MKNVIFSIHAVLSFIMRAFGFMIVALLLYFLIGHGWLILFILLSVELIGWWRVTWIKEQKLLEEVEEDCGEKDGTDYC